MSVFILEYFTLAINIVYAIDVKKKCDRQETSRDVLRQKNKSIEICYAYYQAASFLYTFNSMR